MTRLDSYRPLGFRLAACAVLSIAVAGSASADEPRGALSLTIYSQAAPGEFDPQRFAARHQPVRNPHAGRQVPGFGVVRDIRTVELEAGEQTIEFTHIPALIEPTSVALADLSDPDATLILEQQFLFDLDEPDKLLDRSLNRRVSVRVPVGDGVERTEGILLSAAQGQLVLEAEQGLVIVPRGEAQISLFEPTENVFTRPTLRWLLRAEEAGERQLRTTYQTEGLTWRADYNLILGEDETTARLTAWISLTNFSGVAYPEAELKLVAGDVRRVEPDRPAAMRVRAEAAAMAEDVGFEGREFFDYHLYTLPRRTSIPQNASQQITLFAPVDEVEVERTLVYESRGRQHDPDDRDQVEIHLRVPNTEENNLGRPLPRGVVRAFRADAEDADADADAAGLEFIGEDRIDHTPRGQDILVRIGRAFDVTARRVMTDSEVDSRARTAREAFRIELANAGDEPRRVTVRERLPRSPNWQMIQQSDEFEQIDAQTIEFDVEVPAEGTREITYTVRYTW